MQLAGVFSVKKALERKAVTRKLSGEKHHVIFGVVWWVGDVCRVGKCRFTPHFYPLKSK